MPRRPSGEGNGSLIDFRDAKRKTIERYREALQTRIRDTEQEFNQWLSDVFGEYINRLPGITARAHAFHDLNKEEFEQAAQERHSPIVVEITISNKEKGVEKIMVRQVFVRVDKKQVFWDLKQDANITEMEDVVAAVIKARKMPTPLISRLIERQRNELYEARDYLVHQLQSKGDEDMNRKLWSDSCARTEVFHEAWIRQ